MVRSFFRLLLVCSLCVATISAQSQVQKLIGSSGFDDGWVVSITPEGGYLIAGQTTSAGAGDKDVFVTKLGPGLDVQWTRVLGGVGEDWIDKAVGLTDSAFVFVGFTAVPGREWDGWVFKMDLTGTLLWSKRYGGTGNDMLVDIMPRPGGELLVMGHTMSYGAGGWDYWALRLDAQGNVLGSRTYGGSNTEALNTFTPTSDGGFLIAGHTYSYGFGMHDVALVKLSTTLDLQWMKTYGTSADETAYVLHERQGGGYVAVCGTHAGAFGIRDAMVLSVDTAGIMIQAWSIGTGGEDQLVRGVDLGHLGLIVAGWASDAGGILDGWYIHLSDSGSLESSIRCGGPASDRLISASRTMTGELIFAGNSASGAALGTDAYFIRTSMGGPALPGSGPGPSTTEPIILSVGSVNPAASSPSVEVLPGPDSVLSVSFGITDLHAPQVLNRKISIPNVFGRAGDPVTIPIMLEDPFGVAGADLTLAFDTSIVAVHGVRRGTLTPAFTLAFNVSRPDSVLVSLAHANGIDNNQPGSLFMLDGTIKPDVPDSIMTSYVVAVARLYDAAAELTGVDTAEGTLSTTFGKKGDVNLDGVVNAADAIIVLRLSAGLEQRNERDRWAADFDGNGMVSPFDAVGVLRAAVGLTTPHPGDTLLPPVRIFVAPITASTGQVVEMPVRIDGLPDMVSGTLEFGFREDLVQVRTHKPRGSFDGLVAMGLPAAARAKLVFAAADAWGRTDAEVAAIELQALGSMSGYVPSLLGGSLTDKDGRSVNTFQFITTGVDDAGVVSSFALHPNHPNPFNPSTAIRFDVSRRSRIHLAVYNLLGQTVDVLVNDVRPAGTYRADWHAKMGSGVYFCTMMATDEATGNLIATFTQKLLLLK